MAATVSEKFTAAVKVVQCMPKDGPFQPSYEMKKRFYGLYKQATVGPCAEPKPAFWEAIKRAKWDAWSRLGGMPKDKAMDSYVDNLLEAMLKNKEGDQGNMQHIVETMPISEDVSAFLKAMGPFFEAVNEPLGVPEEEKWRFFEGSTPKDNPQHKNGSTNGDHASDSQEDLNGDSSPIVASSALANHTRPVESDSTVIVKTKLNGANGSVGPNGDVYRDQSHPFVSMADGDLSPDTTHEDPARETNGMDRSSCTSGDVTVSSDSDTESEDFCDSMDQPDTDQIPQLMKASAIEEPLKAIREEELLMTSTPLARKVTTQAEVHQFRGHDYRNGDAQLHNSEGIENGETPISVRGGGEVTQVGRGQGGRGQGSSEGDQRGFVGPGRGYGLDSTGGGRTQSGGQSGAAGGRDPTDRRGRSSSIDISEQINIALQRLQSDMSSVLIRLNTLEALALSQAQQAQAQRQVNPEGQTPSTPPSHRRSWLSWLFPRALPGRTVFFLLVWPLIVNVLLVLWRRRRHRHLRR
ncbi:acyl-CoA-binding domain-containing protein 5A-like isoform X1 [Asterias rubens]|uniref:acyl-CoA-binding domain-containing protein 5A-like isoform X1 n=1 Tax=Asterias rubens TaxID=7604 RepID=UPI0014556086|nr:acyl-CoA-binding domain-containing protein 5A-like isoform X1 [Asterias rubens]